MKKHHALLGALLLAAGAPFWGGNALKASPEPQAVSRAATTIATGVVVDSNGEPVIGASVTEQGTTRGTVTDVDGKFSLRASVGGTLQITYVGAKSATVTAGKDIKVVLDDDNALLDEVVVVGYGQQKRANLTGAVSTVDLDKTVNGRPQSDLAKALQGAVPGLTITTDNGHINQESTIRIRGVGTLSNDEVSNPLIIVDGVPCEDMSFLNAQDIESISVLKDAASSSIYGARAAFGVILITTKQARTVDKVTVNYSNNFAWDQATEIPSYPDVVTQLEAAIDGNLRAGTAANATELFGMYFTDLLPYAKLWKEQNGGKKAKYRNMRQYVSDSDVGDYYLESDGTALYYADWDVGAIFFNNAAPSQTHNVSVQGTSGRTNYYASFGYNYKEGILNFNPEKLKKYNVAFNLTTALTDWLQVGLRFNFNRKEYTEPNTTYDTYQYLWRWGSFFGPYGTIDGTDFRVIGTLQQAGDDETITDQTKITAFMKADIIDGLTLNADFTYQTENEDNTTAKKSITVYNNWSTIYEPTSIVGNSSTAISQSSAKTNYWALNVYANYAKTFASNHNFNVMIGANAEEKDYRYLYADRDVLIDENMLELNLTSETGMTNTSAHTQSATAGYFGRINYDYKGIYLLELNGRYDGSSSFPVNDKWAFFPSASIGYRFSEESYFKPLRHIISNGKVRASYGEIGNEAVGDYMFVSLISQVSSSYSYWMNSSDDGKLTMYYMPDLVSESLTWERIRTIDVGLDLGLFNNEVTLGFDWFQRENVDMLAPEQELPATLGADAPYTNAGTLRTRGWELSINWKRKFGEFDVYANFNISDSKTKIIEWNNDSRVLSDYWSGKTYGDIYGFITDRYFEVSDFTWDGEAGVGTPSGYADGVADQSGLQTGNFIFGPGDIKYKDLNGDGVIDGGSGTADDMGDLTVIGNSLPRYEYSFHIGGAWKGIDVDLYFQGVGKRDVWTISSFNFPLMRSADLAIYANQTSYNTVDYDDDGNVTAYYVDQSNTYPRLYAGNNGTGNVSGIGSGTNNYYPQSRYLTDMSYLRLKNVTVGYTFPYKWTKKAFIEKARIYFSGTNLFLLHKGSGDLPVDPEVNDTDSSLSYAAWGRTAPINRTYSFGIQVTF